MGERTAKIMPFAGGFESESWLGRNCDQCAKGKAWRSCDVGDVLAWAWWDGAPLTPKQAARLGYDPATQRLAADCPERVTRADLLAERDERRGGRG